MTTDYLKKMAFMGSTIHDISNSTSSRKLGLTTSKNPDDENSSLNPFVIGLILESGILAVVFGNLLVLLSLRVQKYWAITDILLLSLSTADFVGGSFPLQIVIFMNYFLQQNWTEFLCGFFFVMVHTLRFASAGTVILITIERTLMILWPLKYHTTITISRIRKVVLFNWLIAVFFASLPFMGVGKSGFEDGKCFYHLSDLGRTYAILIVSTSFVLLAIVLICWIAIKSSSTRFIRRQTTMDTKNKRAGNDVSRGSIPEEYCERSRERRKSNPSGVREIRRLSRMMAVVVFLYYISWLPILISNIVTLVTEKRSSKLVVLLTGMVSLIYALANPIIYGTMSMRYRWAYKRVFGAACSICGCTQRPRSLSASSNLSMSRSRALTVSQLFSDLASKETAAKEGNHGRQNTAYEQAEDAVYGKSNDVTVSSDDLSGGTRGMVSC